MLFPDPLFARLLPTTGDVRPVDNVAITAMFGVPIWHAIWRAKLDGEIGPAEARDEYVNLMRWRLEINLGYRWTHQLEVRNTFDRPLYHMIFATDSEPGHKIMSHIYDKAISEFPERAQQARNQHQQRKREELGHYDLFSSAGGFEALGGSLGPVSDAPEKVYEYEAPEEPREHHEATCPYCEWA
jgi:hypothetical protein